MRIPHTLLVLCDCWKEAEKRLAEEIGQYARIGEESITEWFHKHFKFVLIEASKDRLIEMAFLDDLNEAFPGLVDGAQLARLAHGLIADVTLHNRRKEGETGGDMGFMISRPQISRLGDTLSVDSYRRGLLCQAKLKDVKGKWRNLEGHGKRQMKALADKLEYLGLLLYSYDEKTQYQLRPFLWQLCDTASSIEEVNHWLRQGNFPSLTDSRTVIQGVGAGKIGTDDGQVIDEIVVPDGNRSLIIRIDWPEGSGPASVVQVSSKAKRSATVSVCVSNR